MSDETTIIRTIVGGLITILTGGIAAMFKKAINKSTEEFKVELEILKNQHTNLESEVHLLKSDVHNSIDRVYNKVNEVKTDLKEDMKETRTQLGKIYSHLLGEKRD